MTFDERFSYLVVGLAIGFVFGYMTRSLKKIERKVDDVDRIVKHRDERGFMRFPWLADIAMLLVFAITVFAAFQSQKVSNEVQEAQRQQKQVIACTESYLTKTITALNERTEYTAAASAYNVELQKAQAAFLRLALIEPPLPEDEIEDGLRDYFTSLTEFVDASARTRAKQLNFPYPTENEFANCVSSAKEK